MRHIPSLDGLRATSIALVVLWHFNTVPVPGLWRFDYGNLGVRVFFLISGFLITSLLLEERAASQTIRLGAFYVRRVARIMPAYCLYLAVNALLPQALMEAATCPAFLYLADYQR